MEDAVSREVFEELDLKVINTRLIGVYSKPERHPKQVVNMAYLVDAKGEPKAGDDAADFKWFSLRNLPGELAFNHKEIISDSFNITL